MEKKKTLFLSDLDGTLLNEKAELTQDAAMRLNRLIDKGMCFSIATARTFATVKCIMKEVSLKLPIILMNGVMVYDPVKDICIRAEVISQQSLKHVLSGLRALSLTGFVYTLEDGQMHTYYEHLATRQMKEFLEERERKYQKKFEKTDSFENLLHKEVIYFSMLDTETVLRPLYEKLKEDDGLHISFYKDVYGENLWYLEISSAKASKYQAACFLKEYTKADYLVGFGDNLNDLPLFQACDITCAVENAQDEVRQAADYITGSNLTGGVPDYLEKNFENLINCSDDMHQK